MHKTFLGVRLKTLREQEGLTQAALAARLDLSPSYLNQIENNQRPLTVPVLLRLQAAFGVDLQMFSEDAEARTMSALREIVAEVSDESPVPSTEIQALVQQLPAMSSVVLKLHRRQRALEERLATIAGSGDGDHFSGAADAPLQPHEEVREFFYARHSSIAMLDERAEALHARVLTGASDAVSLDDSGALGDLLERYMRRAHRIQVRRVGAGVGDPGSVPVRSYDPKGRILTIAADASPGQRAFQLGIQLALLEVADLMESFTTDRAFSSGEARALARIGFANHFAGCLVLPYRRFQDAAEEVCYDIELLSARFSVSVETVCHRLSTMQRTDARAIPFFFVRVDRAGNISKRQSSSDFHFSRTGGTCPLWAVYEAFGQPGKVLTQLSRMPDGRTYLWIATAVTHRKRGFGSPQRQFALALGCDARHASRLVYGRTLELANPESATPIGAGCKVCEREDCAQRAFPALGRPLAIDENVRQFAPYEPAK